MDHDVVMVIIINPFILCRFIIIHIMEQWSFLVANYIMLSTTLAIQVCTVAEGLVWAEGVGIALVPYFSGQNWYSSRE